MDILARALPLRIRRGLEAFADLASLAVAVLPQIYRGVLPFILIYLIALLLITFVPVISLAPLAQLKP